MPFANAPNEMAATVNAITAAGEGPRVGPPVPSARPAPTSKKSPELAGSQPHASTAAASGGTACPPGAPHGSLRATRWGSRLQPGRGPMLQARACPCCLPAPSTDVICTCRQLWPELLRNCYILRKMVFLRQRQSACESSVLSLSLRGEYQVPY